MADGGPPGGSRGPAFACLGAMVLIGSTTAAAAKVAVAGLPLGLLPLIRFGVAGLVLAPLAIRGGSIRRIARSDGGRLIAASACCVVINQAFFLAGARLAPTAHIGLIYAACPLVVLALAAAMGQERLAAGRVIGVGLSVAGVGLIALENVWATTATGRDVVRGDLLEVGAVLAWGAYLAINKPLVARHGALPTLAATCLVGTVLDIPFALASGPTLAGLAAAPASAWLAVLYLGLVNSVAGLAAQNLAMRRLDASQVATVGNIAPLLTVAWGRLLFDERITLVAAFGGFLVLLGIAYANRPARPARVAAMPVAPG